MTPPPDISVSTIDQLVVDKAEAFGTVAAMINVASLHPGLLDAMGKVMQYSNTGNLAEQLNAEGLGYALTNLPDVSAITSAAEILGTISSNFINTIASIEKCDFESAFSLLYHEFNPDFNPIDDAIRIGSLIGSGLSVLITFLTPWVGDEPIAVIGFLSALGIGATIGSAAAQWITTDNMTALNLLEIIVVNLGPTKFVGKIVGSVSSSVTSAAVDTRKLSLIFSATAAKIPNIANMSTAAALVLIMQHDDFRISAMDLMGAIDGKAYLDNLDRISAELNQNLADHEAVIIKDDGPGMLETGASLDERLDIWLRSRGVDDETLKLSGYELSQRMREKYQGVMSGTPFDLQETLLLRLERGTTDTPTGMG